MEYGGSDAALNAEMIYGYQRANDTDEEREEIEGEGG